MDINRINRLISIGDGLSKTEIAFENSKYERIFTGELSKDGTFFDKTTYDKPQEFKYKYNRISCDGTVYNPYTIFRNELEIPIIDIKCIRFRDIEENKNMISLFIDEDNELLTVYILNEYNLLLFYALRAMQTKCNITPKDIYILTDIDSVNIIYRLDDIPKW